MTRRRRILLVIVGLPLLLASGLGVWLATADLGRFRGSAERMASKALGRQVVIAGAFEPRLSPHPGLVAENVSLARPPWNGASPRGARP